MSVCVCVLFGCVIKCYYEMALGPIFIMRYLVYALVRVSQSEEGSERVHFCVCVCACMCVAASVWRSVYALRFICLFYVAFVATTKIYTHTHIHAVRDEGRGTGWGALR